MCSPFYPDDGGSSETLLTIYIKLYGVTAHNLFTAVRTSKLIYTVLPLPKLEEGGLIEARMFRILNDTVAMQRVVVCFVFGRSQVQNSI
jgi:hypothetical protein